MIRNSILYRRLWYIRRRNSKRIHIFSRLIVIIIILALLISYATNTLLPGLVEVSESRVRSLINNALNDAVNNAFENSARYEHLIRIDRDAGGNVTLVEADIAKMNMISAQISADIQKKLQNMAVEKIAIPAGALLGNTVLSGSGPELHADVVFAGHVESDFKSEFKAEGLNQTRHSIYLEVKTTVGIAAPLVNRKTEIVTNIPIADTIIVGKVPEIYMRSHW